MRLYVNSECISYLCFGIVVMIGGGGIGMCRKKLIGFVYFIVCSLVVSGISW